MERSAVHCAVVLTVPLWLFAGFGSVVDAETLAAFVIVPPHVYVLGMLKAIVKVRVCPFVRLKLLHTTFVPLTAHPVLDCPALNVSPVGMGSLTTTFVAVFGPPFVAVTV
jgi:hypothetical protein